MMANDWLQRPLDYRNLLNPAFCGVVLAKGAKEYAELAGHGMPLSLMFLLLPLTLSAEMRNILPTNSASSLTGWIHEHPEARIGLADHARESVNLTRQAILFCVQRRTLSVDADQLVSIVPYRMSASDALEESSPRIEDIIRRVKFLGRWFARSGEPATIFYLFGLRP
jgi:hypothetical protein